MTRPGDGEWKDRPDADGWWWLSRGAALPPAIVCVVSGRATDMCGDTVQMDIVGRKWLRIPDPPPPPKPLPKSREVTLTAKVYRNGKHWAGKVSADMKQTWYETAYFDYPSGAIEWCRQFGIEPEVDPNG